MAAVSPFVRENLRKKTPTLQNIFLAGVPEFVLGVGQENLLTIYFVMLLPSCFLNLHDGAHIDSREAGDGPHMPHHRSQVRRMSDTDQTHARRMPRTGQTHVRHMSSD